MQLRLTAQEFNLLADILLNEGGPVSMLDQVLARNLHLGFDELDQLREILVAHVQKRGTPSESTEDAKTTQEIEYKQRVLESMIDKINEDCATI